MTNEPTITIELTADELLTLSLALGSEQRHCRDNGWSALAAKADRLRDRIHPIAMAA